MLSVIFFPGNKISKYQEAALHCQKLHWDKLQRGLPGMLQWHLQAGLLNLLSLGLTLHCGAARQAAPARAAVPVPELPRSRACRLRRPPAAVRCRGPVRAALGWDARAREPGRAGRSWRRWDRPSRSAVHWLSPRSPRPQAFEAVGRATSGSLRGAELVAEGR